MARKILLADDSVTAQNMGRRILSDAGYEVITVNNGSAALKKVAEVTPDLIILDVYMPGYGGLEVCQRLKESAATARIPVLISVGKLEPFKADEAKRVRADAHIVKPFDANELLAVIIKLEDRIVPQSAISKPGRSKTIPSIEESSPRRAKDKPADRAGETTSGWKRRLSVPRGAPKKEPEVIEPHFAGTAFQDLGRREDAETPETKNAQTSVPEAPLTVAVPEEIAAIAETKPLRSFLEKFGEDSPMPAIQPGENPATPSLGDAKAASPEKSVEVTPDTRAETQQETSGLSPLPAGSETETLPRSVEKFGEVSATAGEELHTSAQDSDAKPVSSDNSVTTPQDVAPIPAPAATHEERPPVPPRAGVVVEPPTESEVMAALASLAEVNSAGSASSERLGVGEISFTEKIGDAPMGALGAAFSAVDALRSGPRWVADPVTLSDAESHLTLEVEMEKAYAAFAAAEGARAAEASVREDSAVPETTPSEAPVSTLSEVPEQPVFISEVPPPEIAIVASTTPDAAATDSVAQIADADAEPVSFIDRVAQTVEASTGSEVAEAPSVAESSFTNYREIAYAAAAGASSAGNERAGIEPAVGSPPEVDPPAAQAEESLRAETVTEPPAETVEEVPSAVGEPAAADSQNTDGQNQGRESELAAAWQNWKQIRESVVAPQAVPPAETASVGFKDLRGEDPRAEDSRKDELRPEEPAQGKETVPEIAPDAQKASADAAAIAAIVDNMLAELKPKLMEQIAKKLAEERK